MCITEITSLYDISKIILGCNLPPQYEFLYAIFTLVLSIGFIVTILAPFWLVYKIFD